MKCRQSAALRTVVRSESGGRQRSTTGQLLVCIHQSPLGDPVRVERFGHGYSRRRRGYASPPPPPPSSASAESTSPNARSARWRRRSRLRGHLDRPASVWARCDTPDRHRTSNGTHEPTPSPKSVDHRSRNRPASVWARCDTPDRHRTSNGTHEPTPSPKSVDHRSRDRPASVPLRCDTLVRFFSTNGCDERPSRKPAFQQKEKRTRVPAGPFLTSLPASPGSQWDPSPPCVARYLRSGKS